MNWDELFRNINNLNVMVIGDVMLDSYLFGKVDRISPEAPVPVVALENRELRPGGAANVALNLRALGANVTICSVIGADEGGQNLVKLLESENIGTTGIISSTNRKTTVKHRIIGNNVQMLRVDDESMHGILAAEEQQLLAWVKEHIREYQVVIFEDYDKGVLAEELITGIISEAQAANVPTVVDPKKKNFLAYKEATLFKPNLKEIKEGLKTDNDLRDTANLKLAVDRLKKELNNKIVMITLSEQGVAITNHNEWLQLPAHTRTIADVSGAGDTVVSVAACCLALNCSLLQTAFLANLAGGLVCEKVGVVPVDKEILLKEAKRLYKE